MKIFLLTPIYEYTTLANANTPVVHYFAKEWIKMGHEVTVIHLQPKFPTIFYLLGKLFKNRLSGKFGIALPTDCPKKYKAKYDGVNVVGITYKHYIPHSRMSKSTLTSCVKEIAKECNNNYVPDVFIGHWYNPLLDVLPELKDLFKRPTCLVFHNYTFNLDKMFGSDYKEKLSKIDIIGFRNTRAKKTFEQTLWKPLSSFIASSGVSSEFLDAYNPKQERTWNKYIFVGTLFPRKYPAEILSALYKNNLHGEFSMTYVGDGICEQSITQIYNDHNKEGKVILTGRLPRKSVIERLASSDIFIMISEKEIFGLVYLEAMALGLITIGSRNEGIDGIIVDGWNGFLCNPGDTNELSNIINKIRDMSTQDLNKISMNARKTAVRYSDENVAKDYINYVIGHIC